MHKYGYTKANKEVSAIRLHELMHNAYQLKLLVR